MSEYVFPDKSLELVNVEEQALIDKGYPPALAKAVYDTGDYALMLRNRTVIEFERAEPRLGDWVWLGGYINVHFLPSWDDPDLQWILDRGIDVRLSEIAWVADAPHGS